AIADENFLYSLGFDDHHADQNLTKYTKTQMIAETNPLLIALAQELAAYFSGNLRTFQTPISPIGSPFQKKVWQALRNIPYGQTQSYAALAQALGQPAAYRAVGNANSANPLVIIHPCHRVIKNNGALGGYSA